MSFIERFYSNAETSERSIHNRIKSSIKQREVSLLNKKWYNKFPPFHALNSGDITSNLVSSDILQTSSNEGVSILHDTHDLYFINMYIDVVKHGRTVYNQKHYNVYMNIGNSNTSIYILRKLMGIPIPNIQTYGIDTKIDLYLREQFYNCEHTTTLSNKIGSIFVPSIRSNQLGILGIRGGTMFINIPHAQDIQQIYTESKDAYIKSIYANITRYACINKGVNYYHSEAFNQLVRHDNEPKWTKRLIPDITEYNRRRRLTQKWIIKLYQVLYDDMYNYLRYFTPEIVCDGIYVNRDTGYMDGSEFNDY